MPTLCKGHMWRIHCIGLIYRGTLPLHGSLMSLIHEMYFFINSQLHLVVFVLNRFLAALRNELLWGKYYTSNCLSALTHFTLISGGKGRINTTFLHMSRSKATNCVRYCCWWVSNWLSSFVAQGAHRWWTVVDCVSRSPAPLGLASVRLAHTCFHPACVCSDEGNYVISLWGIVFVLSLPPSLPLPLCLSFPPSSFFFFFALF